MRRQDVLTNHGDCLVEKMGDFMFIIYVISIGSIFFFFFFSKRIARVQM